MKEAKQDNRANRRTSSELSCRNDKVCVIVENAQSERTTESFREPSYQMNESFDEPSHRHAEEHELTQYFGGEELPGSVGTSGGGTRAQARR